MADTNPASSTPAPRTLWQLVSDAHTTIIMGALVAFVGSALKVVPYIALVEIARQLLSGHIDTVWWWAGGAIIAMIIHAVAYGWALGVNHIVEADLRHDLRQRIIDKLSRVPLGWFNDRSTGKIRKAVTSDTSEIHTLVAHAAGDIANTAGALIAGLVYLFYVNVAFAAIMVGIWVVLIGVTTVMSGAGMSQSFKDFAHAERQLSAATVELVDGIKEVKNFGMTGKVYGRFDEARRYYTAVSLQWLKQSGVQVAIISAAMQPATTLTLTIGLGYWLTTIGWLTPVQVLAFALVWIGIPEGLQALMQITQYLYTAKQAAHSTLQVLQADELTVRQDTPLPKGDINAQITFDHVQFGYDPDHPVINDVSFTCQPGTLTALVGPSGGGKSTVARLIARFWDVDRGAVTVGGVDVRDQSSQELLSHIALVFQDIVLVSGTVRDNIALGTPDATDEEIIAAAKAAHIHDRIMRLPDGYDTRLGEGSGFLSGGERQRVTIARAILRAPEILILDEATSQADPHSELEIQRAISALAADRTVVMIAHRLSTIASADQILVFDAGRICERGTHDQLMNAGGLYAHLWKTQHHTPSHTTPER